MGELDKYHRRRGANYSRGHARMYKAACRLLENARKLSILDVGSGMGYGYRWLQRYKALRGGSYTGIESDIDCVRWCQDRYPKAIWKAKDWPIPNYHEVHDYTFCIEVLEHVTSDPHAFLQELGRVSKKGIFLSTPNKETSFHCIYTPKEVLEMLSHVGLKQAAYVEQQWTTWFLITPPS